MNIYSTNYFSFQNNDSCISFHTYKIKNKIKNNNYTLPGYNYCGPGTQYFTLVKNKIKPTSLLDKLSKKHDHFYSHANDYEDILFADKEFIEDIKSVKNNLNKKERLLSILIIIIFKIKIFLKK